MNSDEMNETIKKTLDERENNVPAPIQSALTQARYSAVNAAKPIRKSYSSWLWSGAASLASITLVVVLWQPMLTGSGAENAVFDDIELLASEEDLGFYEDLEFIAWVDEMEQSG
jgi:hypothetical protein